MDESDPGADATRLAIECLTAWIELGPRAAAEHITHLLGDDGVDPNHIIIGQINLGMVLLYLAAKNAGADDLKAAGAEILREIGRGMQRS